MENNIVMTKEQRAALLDRIDVLNKVKAVMLMPGILMVTVKQLAEYFEETVDNIHKCYSSHKAELISNGACLISPSELRERLSGKKCQSVGSKHGTMICIEENYYFEMNNRGALFFPPRAILNMAMLLPKSRVAQEIRSQLLNITEMTAPMDRIIPIENEQEMLNDIGRAYVAGDLTAFAAATSKYSGYLSRNLAAATAQISTLNTEKAEAAAQISALNTEKAEATAKIATLNTEKAALSEVNAMLSEKAMVWDPRQTLNALIRAIAASAFDHKYSAAWDRFYRELKYRTGILIAQRRGVRSGKPPLDAIRDEEWPQLMKVAASLCYDYCVDVIYATNEETVRAYNLDTIETEFGVRKNHGTVVIRSAADAPAAAPM